MQTVLIFLGFCGVAVAACYVSVQALVVVGTAFVVMVAALRGATPRQVVSAASMNLIDVLKARGRGGQR